jgi:DNA-nicking Smr family endonuclease
VSIVESLRRLFDPAAHRQEEAERRAAREKPIREETGPPKWFECRVCRHLGPEPTFCPTCLAGTMRPTRKVPAEPPPADAPTAEAPPASELPDAWAEEGSARRSPSREVRNPPRVLLPFDGTLDLHTFAPKEVGELLPEYLLGCQQRGQLQVRIVHGKGTGAMRRTVQALLSRDPRVESFRAAGEDAGGWGATLVTLRPG